MSILPDASPQAEKGDIRMKYYISSKTNEKVKRAFKLRQEKYREQYQLFLAEGRFDLEMALKYHAVVEVFTCQEIKLDETIPQYIVSEEIIQKLSSSSTPQGIVFVCKMFNHHHRTMDKIVYLDGISDPGNMGTIIRTALAFGYDGVVYSPGSVSMYNPKVIASSKGAIFALPVLEGNLASFQSTHHIYASVVDEKAVDIRDIYAQKPFVLVIGSEARGVSTQTLALAEKLIYIPISNIDSINAAVAAGIMMYALK